MILLIHDKALRVVEVRRNSVKLQVSPKPAAAFWELARKFPEEVLIWVEQDLEEYLKPEVAEKRIFHERNMVSYAAHSKFLPESIGYIDQFPFININREVRYPTWRMSGDVGGIKGKTLLSFEKDFKHIDNFPYLLNSIAKVGQQNGLFCYSDPGLIDISQNHKEPIAGAGATQLFSFVYSHYQTIWVFVLFFCLVRYEARFPIIALCRSFFHKKLIGKQVDLPEITNPSAVVDASIDVIIPTLGRPAYLEQVVKDLSRQLLLPERVIIVEQNPDLNSISELAKLVEQKWPFEITHIFTHETGACMARNKALDQVSSNWVFFSDDDQRIEQDFLKSAMEELKRLGVSCLTTAYLQPGEKKVFDKVKQWATFGAGNSIVSSETATSVRFDTTMEYGYGEDKDFGMRLRNIGCDIIYHPDLEIKHLKAPSGGFRKKMVKPWEEEGEIIPKPSPTLMRYINKYYSKEQLLGFRLKMWLEYYSKQNIKNPLTYCRSMNRRWKRSELWAKQLELKAGHEI